MNFGLRDSCHQARLDGKKVILEMKILNRDLCFVTTACFSYRGCWLVRGLERVCSIGLISLSAALYSGNCALIGFEARQKVS